MTQEQIQELLKRITILESQVRLLKSKHPYRSLGKGKNLQTPSKQKIVIAQ